MRKTQTMLQIQKSLLSMREFRHILESRFFLKLRYLSVGCYLSEILEGKDIFGGVSAFHIFHQPYSSESSFSYINIFGGFQQTRKTGLTDV